jgi:hypothetical protein
MYGKIVVIRRRRWAYRIVYRITRRGIVIEAIVPSWMGG